MKVLALYALRRRRRKRHQFKRSYWIHPTNARRKAKGEYYNLVQELRSDEDRFVKYFRPGLSSMYGKINSICE